MAQTGGNDPKTVKSNTREARLSAALRENLRRRKAQASGRAGGARPAGAGQAPKKSEDG